MKILSLSKQLKFPLIFTFTFQDQAQTSISNITSTYHPLPPPTISYDCSCFPGTLQICRKAALCTLIPTNTDSFLAQIASENFSTRLKNRHYVATELPNFEFLKNILLTYTRPQVLHRKGRIAAQLRDLFFFSWGLCCGFKPSWK